MICRCGCPDQADTKTGWKRGHWNKGLGFRGTRHTGPHSADTIEKISKAKIGQKFGVQHRMNIGRVQTGRKQSLETRLKRSASMKGKHSGEKNPAWIPDRDEAWLRKKTFGLIRSLLGRAMKQVSSPKFDVAVKELGYSPRELRVHLESLFQPGMTWQNHGKGTGKWHIDHIRLVSSFPIGTLASEVNALSNLRPLWEHENLRRARK